MVTRTWSGLCGRERRDGLTDVPDLNDNLNDGPSFFIGTESSVQGLRSSTYTRLLVYLSLRDKYTIFRPYNGTTGNSV